jgi:hypothetical protein
VLSTEGDFGQDNWDFEESSKGHDLGNVSLVLTHPGLVGFFGGIWFVGFVHRNEKLEVLRDGHEVDSKTATLFRRHI